jgi:hypothetical protein
MIPGDDFAATFLTVRFAAFLVVVLATAERDLVADLLTLVTFFAAFLVPAFLEPLVFFKAFAAERDFVLVRLLVLAMFSLSLKLFRALTKATPPHR